MKFPILTGHILIVEENQVDFVLIQNYLREEFFEIIIDRAKTFMEANAKLQGQIKYDTILLDLSLSDTNEVYLISEIVRLALSSPVIILINNSDKDFSIKMLSLGISDYLLKDEISASRLYKSITYSIERSRINKELIDSEENYRNLFDLSPIPMWVYNLETLQFLNVNKAAIDNYGYTKSEFLSMNIFDLQPEEDIEINKPLLNILKDGLPIRNNFRHVKKNGELINVEIKRSIYSTDNKTGLALSMDVTINFYQKSILAIEKKVYENAKGYNTISDFKAAIVALDNFVADYPGTPFKEDALYYKLDSAYQLGINSIPSKMEERLNVAKTAQANLIKFNGETKYKKVADEMLARIEKDLQKFTK